MTNMMMYVNLSDEATQSHGLLVSSHQRTFSRAFIPQPLGPDYQLGAETQGVTFKPETSIDTIYLWSNPKIVSIFESN